MKNQLTMASAKLNRAWVPAIALMIASLWFLPTEAQAQVGLAGEGRVGVTFPQGDLSDSGAEAGLSLGAELQANFRPNLTAYFGIQRHTFNCDNGCTLADNPRSTGVGAGLKYVFHNPGDVLAWGRGGIVAHTFTSDAGSGDRELGFELGVGADLPVADRLYLVPNIGFVSHDAGIGLKANFFTLGVGVHYHLR